MSVIRPRRVKIGRDPNNTNWARDETSFGQRMLRSQGWQPGDVLGDKNSLHFGMHSAASTGHIRVALKDDSNGLGWKAGGPDGDDALTGMDVLKDIFGRLNGKGGEEGRREQERKKGLMYLGRRGGGIAFVRGGLLVGDEMKKPENSTESSSEDEDSSSESDSDPSSTDQETPPTHSTAPSPPPIPVPVPTTNKPSASDNLPYLRAKSAKALKRYQKAQKKASKLSAALASAETNSPVFAKAEKATRKAEKAAKKAERADKKVRKAEKKEKKEKKERGEARQKRVLVRSRLSTHRKAPLDSDAMKRLFMVG